MNVFTMIVVFYWVTIILTSIVSLLANKNRVIHTNEKKVYDYGGHYTVTPGGYHYIDTQAQGIGLCFIPIINLVWASYVTIDYLSDKAVYDASKKVYDAARNDRVNIILDQIDVIREERVARLEKAADDAAKKLELARR